MFNNIIESLGRLQSNVNLNELHPENINTIRCDAKNTMFYVISIMETYHLDLEECTAQSYNEIKNRNGKVVNDVFVKEADL